MKIRELRSISVTREGGTLGIKSGIVWGNRKGVAAPVMYLTKPRHMEQEVFDEYLKAIKISFKVVCES